MSRLPTWPPATIRELLARAEILGTAQAELASKASAESFRWAIYWFKRNNNLGQDLSVSVEDNVVIVRKRPDPAVIIDTINMPGVVEP